jgi:hypothetical protein
MKRPKIALLYHPRVIDERERAAAAEGLGEFRRFGIICEEINVEGSVSRVKRGAILKNAINSTDVSVHPFDLHHIPISEFLRGLLSPPDTMGIAVTGAVLFEIGEGERLRRLGISAHGIGGIVSISRLREVCYARQKLEAIRLAVMRQTGHVIGRPDHCSSDGCLMQENKDHMDFVERFAERNPEFCRDCRDRISDGISKLAGEISF